MAEEVLVVTKDIAGKLFDIRNFQDNSTTVIAHKDGVERPVDIGYGITNEEMVGTFLEFWESKAAEYGYAVPESGGMEERMSGLKVFFFEQHDGSVEIDLSGLSPEEREFYYALPMNLSEISNDGSGQFFLQSYDTYSNSVARYTSSKQDLDFMQYPDPGDGDGGDIVVGGVSINNPQLLQVESLIRGLADAMPDIKNGRNLYFSDSEGNLVMAIDSEGLLHPEHSSLKMMENVLGRIDSNNDVSYALDVRRDRILKGDIVVAEDLMMELLLMEKDLLMDMVPEIIADSEKTLSEWDIQQKIENYTDARVSEYRTHHSIVPLIRDVAFGELHLAFEHVNYQIQQNIADPAQEQEGSTIISAAAQQAVAAALDNGNIASNVAEMVASEAEAAAFEGLNSGNPQVAQQHNSGKGSGNSIA